MMSVTGSDFAAGRGENLQDLAALVRAVHVRRGPQQRPLAGRLVERHGGVAVLDVAAARMQHRAGAVARQDEDRVGGVAEPHAVERRLPPFLFRV